MNQEYLENIKNVVDEMTSVAGLDSDYAKEFFNRIIADEGVLQEFVTYLTTGKFTCDNKVANYSVVDILVWQMDHFRAFLDRGLDGMKSNECEMVLKAFETFLKMKENPDMYVRLLTEETGSDFEGKF